MKIISTFFFFLIFNLSIEADEIKIDIILENCKSCHGQNYDGNNYITSLKKLEKDEFISKMTTYSKNNSNNVMGRISKVLNEFDIKQMAEKIYEEVEK